VTSNTVWVFGLIKLPDDNNAHHTTRSHVGEHFTAGWSEPATTRSMPFHVHNHSAQVVHCVQQITLFTLSSSTYPCLLLWRSLIRVSLKWSQITLPPLRAIDKLSAVCTHVPSCLNQRCALVNLITFRHVPVEEARFYVCARTRLRVLTPVFTFCTVQNSGHTHIGFPEFVQSKVMVVWSAEVQAGCIMQEMTKPTKTHTHSWGSKTWPRARGRYREGIF